MNFASDNIMGASAPVLEALVRANSGPLPAYGADEITARVEKRFCALFEREVQTFLAATGTGANALALSAIVPPYGLAVSHVEAHVIDDECGAPEFYMHGAKMAGLPGVGAKIAPATLETFLASLPRRVKQMPASGLSISQATESGLVYTPAEIAALSEVAHRNGLKVHMDGARFANALVALGCTPAEMTWKCGVDILTFGATKNGCLAAEAIVVFDPALAETLGYRRKRGGHLLSKGRLLSALTDEELRGFHRQCSSVNDQSRALFEAWLDRSKAGWREAWNAGPGNGAPASSGKMSRIEALAVLGLKEGATAEDIRAAHRRLMKEFHPDRGGSDYLAAKINQAKDVLL